MNLELIAPHSSQLSYAFRNEETKDYSFPRAHFFGNAQATWRSHTTNLLAPVSQTRQTGHSSFITRLRKLAGDLPVVSGKRWTRGAIPVAAPPQLHRHPQAERRGPAVVQILQKHAV